MRKVASLLLLTVMVPSQLGVAFGMCRAFMGTQPACAGHCALPVKDTGGRPCRQLCALGPEETPALTQKLLRTPSVFLAAVRLPILLFAPCLPENATHFATIFCRPPLGVEAYLLNASFLI